MAPKGMSYKEVKRICKKFGWVEDTWNKGKPLETISAWNGSCFCKNDSESKILEKYLKVIKHHALHSKKLVKSRDSEYEFNVYRNVVTGMQCPPNYNEFLESKERKE